MKTKVLFILTFLLPAVCLSQDLSGKWKGTYTSRPFLGQTSGPIAIRLEFIPGSDSIYSVFSYTEQGIGTNTWTDKCKMDYKRVAGGSVVLEEIELLSARRFQTIGFQKMYLKLVFVKNQIMLKGIWKHVEGHGEDYGEVRLRKQVARKHRQSSKK